MVMIATLVNTTQLINTKAIPAGYVQKEGSSKKLRVKTNMHPAPDAKKLTLWLNDVIVTCFSLTRYNALSKGEYCRKRYFYDNAGDVYYHAYVETMAERLSDDTASIYVGLPSLPIIRRSTSKRRPFTEVQAPVKQSYVTALETKPSNGMGIFFVEVDIYAKNESKFMITAFDYK